MSNSSHFIAIAGLSGYMPTFCQVCDTLAAAAEAIAQRHTLTSKQESRLRRARFLALNAADHGDDYAEIQECTCANPSVHCDN